MNKASKYRRLISNNFEIAEKITITTIIIIIAGSK
jgi:hypothetical protein